MADSDWISFARIQIDKAFETDDALSYLIKFIGDDNFSSDKSWGVRKYLHDASTYNYRIYKDGIGWYDEPRLEALHLYFKLNY
jgi:hypothetical protein